jgi:hypothetical protein
MVLNVCYPTFANQATPRRFGPLFNPCNLPEKIEDSIEEASNCLNDDYQDAHECVAEVGENAGLKYLGAGVHRAGFAFNGCIIKVALNDEGVKANEGEYEAWRQIGTHYKNIFAPVHGHDKDFLWITQPRLVPLRKLRADRAQMLRDRMRAKMEKRGLDCGFDVEAHNIAVKSGGSDPVLFDYGFGTKCTLKTPSGTKNVEVRGAEHV